MGECPAGFFEDRYMACVACHSECGDEGCHGPEAQDCSNCRHVMLQSGACARECTIAWSWMRCSRKRCICAGHNGRSDPAIVVAMRTTWLAMASNFVNSPLKLTKLGTTKRPLSTSNAAM